MSSLGMQWCQEEKTNHYSCKNQKLQQTPEGKKGFYNIGINTQLNKGELFHQIIACVYFVLLALLIVNECKVAVNAVGFRQRAVALITGTHYGV